MLQNRWLTCLKLFNARCYLIILKFTSKLVGQFVCWARKINFGAKRIIFPSKLHMLLHPALFATLPPHASPLGFIAGEVLVKTRGEMHQMLALNWQRQVPCVRCSNAICDSRSDLLRPDVTSSHNTTRYLDSGVEVCLNFAEVCLSSTARSSCPLTPSSQHTGGERD